MDPEDFYAKLLGIGLISYHHDITWAYIPFGEPLRFFSELFVASFFKVRCVRS
jgi:hypothetical protein